MQTPNESIQENLGGNVIPSGQRPKGQKGAELLVFCYGCVPRVVLGDILSHTIVRRVPLLACPAVAPELSETDFFNGLLWRAQKPLFRPKIGNQNRGACRSHGPPDRSPGAFGNSERSRSLVPHSTSCTTIMLCRVTARPVPAINTIRSPVVSSFSARPRSTTYRNNAALSLVGAPAKGITPQ